VERVKAPSAATLVPACALAGALLVPTVPALAATPGPSSVADMAVPRAAVGAAPAGTCAAGVQRPFLPTSMSIQHVTKRSRVIAVGREPHSRVPKTPPLTAAGKWQVAWDRQGIRPGAAHGTAIFDAHTWPWDAPPALGNRMLRHLHEGDRITVRGKHGMLCYVVTRRTSINVREKDPKGFYSKRGKPQIVITVCSGRRLGPGNWARRTYWFARPYVPTSELAPPPTAPAPEPPSSPGLLGGLFGGLFGG
jgi:hypothetical protein